VPEFEHEICALASGDGGRDSVVTPRFQLLPLLQIHCRIPAPRLPQIRKRCGAWCAKSHIALNYLTISGARLWQSQHI
jgi:hypothetical protein